MELDFCFLLPFPSVLRIKNEKNNFEFNSKFLTEKVVPNITNERAKNDA
jgi:hypothetical protein